SNAVLVSCIMPTANRRLFLPSAIQCFLRQDYPARELVVVDDGIDPVDDLMPEDARVHYTRVPGTQSVGAKRNLACDKACGEIVVHWDDDDWSSPQRLTYQVTALLHEGFDLCGLDRVVFFDPREGKAWEYFYLSSVRPWVHGATLCYRKNLWR